MWLQPWVGRLLSKNIETFLNMVHLKIYYYKKKFYSQFPNLRQYLQPLKWPNDTFYSVYDLSYTNCYWFMQKKNFDFYWQKTECAIM